MYFAENKGLNRALNVLIGAVLIPFGMLLWLSELPSRVWRKVKSLLYWIS